MTLSMLGIGLFKTGGLDEYGTAAVGWLRGAGLKETEGPAEHRGGGIPALTHSLTLTLTHTHTRRPCTDPDEAAVDRNSSAAQTIKTCRSPK